MLADDDRAAELTEDRRRRVVRGEVEDVDVPEGAEGPEQWLGLAGVLLQLRAERTQKSIAPLSVTSPRTSS